MEGSDVSTQSSSTPKRRPSMPKGTDENDKSYQDMDVNVKNQKKSTPPVAKNYMSTSVSTASKLNTPRKKVLAERNAHFDSPHHNRHHHHHQKTPSSGLITLESYEKQKSSLDGDDSKWSSSKPYDPLNNYLSPRPKFLRYNPSRRHEILLRLEDKVQEGTDEVSGSSGGEESELGSSSQGGGSSLHSQVGDVKEEGEEIDESSDEEFEEVEEGGGWGFRGLVKFLVLLLGLVLCVSYISPMNSPTPSLVEQSALAIRNESLMVQDHVNGFMKTFESGGYLLDVRDATETECADINQFEKENVDINELDEVEKVPSDESEELKVAADEERGGVDGEVGISEVKEMGEHEEKGEIHDLGDVVEVKEKESADFRELEMEKAGEAVSVLDETDQEMLRTEDQEVFETQSIIDEVDDHIMVSGNTDSFHRENEVEAQVEESPIGIELPMEKTEEAVVDVVEVNMVQEVEGGEVIETQATVFEVYDNKGTVPFGVDGFEKENEIATEAVEEKMVDGEIGYVSDDYELVNDEAGEKAVEWLVELMDGVARYKEVLDFSIFSLVIASSLVLAFHFKRRKNVRNGTSSDVELCGASLRAEKCSSKISNEEDKHIDRFVSIENSKPLIVSLEEDFEMNYPNRAPTVELLSELEVGEMSSSLRHCSMRSRMIQSEVNSHSVSMEKGIGEKAHTTPIVRPSSSLRSCGMRSRMIESEVSSHSVSMEKDREKEIGKKAPTMPVVQPAFSMDKRTSSKVHSEPVQVQPALSGTSATNSPSYGTFISEMKIVAKEEGGNGEGREIITPVRRSSRIRNHTTMS